MQDFPVRILDISYGGLRLELEKTPEARLPRSLCVTLPTSNVAIDVNVVWQKPSGDTGWLCGAAVPDPSPDLASAGRRRLVLSLGSTLACACSLLSGEV